MPAGRIRFSRSTGRCRTSCVRKSAYLKNIKMPRFEHSDTMTSSAARPRIVGVLDPDAEVVIEDDRRQQQAEQVAIRPRHRRRPRLIEQARRDEQDDHAPERPLILGARRAEPDAEHEQHDEVTVRDDRARHRLERAVVHRPRDRAGGHREHADDAAPDRRLPARRRDPRCPRACRASPPRTTTAERRSATATTTSTDHDALRDEPVQRAAEWIPQRVRVLRDQQEHEVAEQQHHRVARPRELAAAPARERVEEEHRDQEDRIVGRGEQHASAHGAGAPGDGAPAPPGACDGGPGSTRPASGSGAR